MKYINTLILILSAGLIGCTFYTPNYYDISNQQWQHMPMQQQTNSIYAYNTEQAVEAKRQTNFTFNPF